MVAFTVVKSIEWITVTVSEKHCMYGGLSPVFALDYTGFVYEYRKMAL